MLYHRSLSRRCINGEILNTQMAHLIGYKHNRDIYKGHTMAGKSNISKHLNALITVTFPITYDPFLGLDFVPLVNTDQPLR